MTSDPVAGTIAHMYLLVVSPEHHQMEVTLLMPKANMLGSVLDA